MLVCLFCDKVEIVLFMRTIRLCTSTHKVIKQRTKVHQYYLVSSIFTLY